MKRFPALVLVLSLAATLALPRPAAPQSGPYQVTRHVQLGGDGGWDYITVDTAGNRIFLTRSDRVMVVDQNSLRLITEIPGLQRGHGVALAYAAGHGFVTSGADSTVTMFDLRTLEVLGTTTAGVDDDAVLFDAASDHVFTFNGDAHSASVIDPVSGERVGTIPLGGKPEFGVSAGNGKVYVNIEDRSEVVEIDARAMKVMRRWSLAPCEEPSGLAIDVAHHRLFSVCHSRVMAISDADAGRVVATVPIGAGVDGARFDPGTGYAFASNGDGTLTVVHQDSPDAYHVVQNVATLPGARTLALDARTHTVYTVSAKFGPMPEGEGRRRPPLVPGSFELMVITLQP